MNESSDRPEGSDSKKRGRWERAAGEDRPRRDEAARRAPGFRGGDREDRRGGYGSRGGDRDDRRGGYGSRGGNRDDRRGGYGSRGGNRDDRRGGYGPGGSDGSERRRGPRSWDRDARPSNERQPRRREPDIPEGVTGKELDRSVWQQLRTLSKENAEGVAQHLAASALLLEEDSDLALEHAQNAVRRAGRVPAAREALGLVLYRRGEFTEALREFRTARRLSGSEHLLPYMVDCERGLGRHQRALDLASSPEARTLAEADNIELAIVVSGVRRDLGQPEAAVMGLRIPALTRATQQPWAARLFYAYADAVLDTGDEAGAHEWFSKALAADQQGETDAAVRLAELEGLVITDLEDEDADQPDEEQTDTDNGGRVETGGVPFSSPDRPQ